MKNPLRLGSPMNYKKIAIIAGIFVAFFYITLAVFYQHYFKALRHPKGEIATFEGLSKDTSIRASINMRGQTQELIVKEGKITLPPELQEKIFVPYEIYITLETPKGETRDIQISLDARGVECDILFDGFSQKDTVTLSYMGNDPIKKMPMDWSGRLKIGVLANPAKDAPMCLKVFPENEQAFGFCQTLAGKQGLI